MKKLKIGSRGSKLAIYQAELVKGLIETKNPDLEIEIIVIKTTGDRILDQNLSEIGGKGLFIKEIEESLLDKQIDLAVHSLKDMPAIIPQELDLVCFLEREQPNDALLCKNASKITYLPENPVIGTSSPRRASQALNLRPDAKIVPFRGNVGTRIDKIKNDEVDATFLAIAGLNRLDITDDIISIVSEDEMLPAVAQGTITVEIRKDSEELKELLADFNHLDTKHQITCERAFQREFEASCRSPIAGLAKINNQQLEFNCLIAKPDGTKIYKTARQGSISDAYAMGKDAAEELKIKAGDNFFE